MFFYKNISINNVHYNFFSVVIVRSITLYIYIYYIYIYIYCLIPLFTKVLDHKQPLIKHANCPPNCLLVIKKALDVQCCQALHHATQAYEC